MTRTLPGLLAIVLCVPAYAQDAMPAGKPKTDPFAGFGNALDKRPGNYHAAATPAPISSLPVATNGLSFEAKLISNGGSGKVVRGGSQITETRESKMLVEVRARNFSATPAEARIEWFFVARDVQSKKSYVWDQGQRQLSLANGSEKVETAESTELKRSTTKTSEIRTLTNPFGQEIGTSITNSSSASGARPYGWIVRMWAQGRLLHVRTSSNDLEALGRTLAPVQ